MTLIEMVRQVLISMPGLSPAMVKAALNRAYSDLAFSWEWAALEKELPFSVKGTYTQDDLAVDGPSGGYADVNDYTLTNGSTDFVLTQAYDGYATVRDHTLNYFFPEHTFDINEDTDLITPIAGTFDPPYWVRFGDDDQAYRVTGWAIVSAFEGQAYAKVTFTLNVPYAGESCVICPSGFNSDTGTPIDFAFFQPVYAIDNTPAVRQILSITGSDVLEELPRATLDRIDPQRTSTTSDPTKWAKAGFSTALDPLVEIWPVPNETKMFKARCRMEPTLLTDSATPLLHPMLIILDAQLQLHAAYAVQNPKAANAIYNSYGVWRTQREALYNTLILEDVRRHSTSKVVRNVAPATASGESINTVYTGGDITSYTP